MLGDQAKYAHDCETVARFAIRWAERVIEDLDEAAGSA